MIADPLLTRSARRSAIIKVYLMLSGSTSQNLHLHLNEVQFFIFHNLATFEDRGMQINILILKGNKIMESKAPNLEGLLQTLASL